MVCVSYLVFNAKVVVLKAVLSQNFRVAGVHVTQSTTWWSFGRRFYFCVTFFQIGYKYSWEAEQKCISFRCKSQARVRKLLTVMKIYQHLVVSNNIKNAIQNIFNYVYMCVRLYIGTKVQYIHVYKHRHIYRNIHNLNCICN